MNKTTRQAILDQQELNREIFNKENPNKKLMNNKTTEQLLKQLIELNNQHIATLNERIDILTQTIEVDYQERESLLRTINIQRETINNYLNNKSNE